MSKDEEWIQKNLDEERREKERLGQKFNTDSTDADENKSKKTKFADDAKAIIAELMTSDIDASQIVGRKRYEAKKAKEEEKLKQAAIETKRDAQKFERIHHHLTTKRNEEIVSLSSQAALGEGEKYDYSPQIVELNGRWLPPIEKLGDYGYLQHIKTASGWQNAGGYYESLGCYRALMEAHCDLFP